MKTREELEKMQKLEIREYAKSLGVNGYSARIENKNGNKSEPTKEILIDRIMDFLTTEPVAAEPVAAEPVAAEPVAAEPKTEGMNIVKIYEFLGFDQDEVSAVVAASKISGMSQEAIIKSGVLTRARKISKEFERTKDLTTEQLKQSTFIGAGHKIIKETIDKLVMSNNAAYDNKTRVFINPSVVRSLTGCNLNSIKQVFDNYLTNDNLETIDEHNSRHQLTNRNNKKGRDELGNRIKISDLIANIKIVKTEKENMKLHFESSKIPTYQAFAAYIDSLENEESIINASKELTQILREFYQNENSLHSELTKYRKEINKLKLKSFATFTHVYGTPRTLKDGDIEPKGCVKNEEGKIVNEPRHIALKYLVLTKEEQDKRNKK